jgi:hypothetical protein
MNRRLSADSNFPFAALASSGGDTSAAPNDFAISQVVHTLQQFNKLFNGNIRLAEESPEACPSVPDDYDQGRRCVYHRCAEIPNGRLSLGGQRNPS